MFCESSPGQGHTAPTPPRETGSFLGVPAPLRPPGRFWGLPLAWASQGGELLLAARSASSGRWQSYLLRFKQGETRQCIRSKRWFRPLAFVEHITYVAASVARTLHGRA